MMNNRQQPPLFRSQPQRPLFTPPQRPPEKPAEQPYDADIHHRILAELKIMNDKLSVILEKLGSIG